MVLKETPQPFELIWNGKPLFLHDEIYSIEDDTLEVMGYSLATVYQVVSPALKPQFEEWGDFGLRVSDQSLYFQREIYQKNYPDGRTEQLGREFRGVYRFGNIETALWICGSTYGKDGIPDPDLHDTLEVQFRADEQGIEVQYHPHTGEVESIQFDLPSEEPRHPVFGPTMQIDLTSLAADYQPHGVLLRPTDMEGNRIESPRSPNVTYAFTRKDEIGVLNLRIGSGQKEIQFPLSLSFNQKDPLDQLRDPKSKAWLDMKFLERVSVFR